MEILNEPDVKILAMSYPVIEGWHSFAIDQTNKDNLEKIIELAARNCYKSKLTNDPNARAAFVNKIVNVNHHESVAEHASLTFAFTCSRSVLAEITRHRLASFSVESQRYVDYDKKGLRFMKPSWIKEEDLKYYIDNDPFEPGPNPDVYTWYNQLKSIEANYNYLRELGWKPEQARDILPNCTACNIIMTANVREWRHIFDLRRAPSAYSEMRVVANKIYKICNKVSPVLFNNNEQS